MSGFDEKSKLFSERLDAYTGSLKVFTKAMQTQHNESKRSSLLSVAGGA